MEFGMFKDFDFGVLPSLSDWFWGVIGVIGTTITFGFTFAKGKALHKLFPAFLEERVYRMANKVYATLFYLSSVILIGIIYYFITKFIFFFLRCLGESCNIPWLVQITKTSLYGFGTMALLVAGTVFFIYYLNKKEMKRQSREKREGIERGHKNGDHFQSVL